MIPSSSLRSLMVPPQLPFKPTRSHRDHSRISMSMGNRMILPSSSIRIIWRFRMLRPGCVRVVTYSILFLLFFPAIKSNCSDFVTRRVLSTGDRLSPITSNSKLCHTRLTFVYRVVLVVWHLGLVDLEIQVPPVISITLPIQP